MQVPPCFSADAARSLGGPDWLADRRLRALENFAESPPPATDEDLWRYGRIAELDLERYLPSGTGLAGGLQAALEADAWPQSAALLEHVGERSGLAVVVDGMAVTRELSPAAAAHRDHPRQHPRRRRRIGRARSGEQAERAKRQGGAPA